MFLICNCSRKRENFACICVLQSSNSSRSPISTKKVIKWVQKFLKDFLTLCNKGCQKKGGRWVDLEPSAKEIIFYLQWLAIALNLVLSYLKIEEVLSVWKNDLFCNLFWIELHAKENNDRLVRLVLVDLFFQFRAYLFVHTQPVLFTFILNLKCRNHTSKAFYNRLLS